jgi:hypothetical protein
VNYDNIDFIIPNDAHSSLVTFRGGGTLLVKGTLNRDWPLGDKALIYPDGEHANVAAFHAAQS